MPFQETLPVDDATAQWSLWSTTARIVVGDPSARDEAQHIVAEVADTVDRACSRFRTDSELSQLAGRSGTVTVSPLLAELVSTALEAARTTGGLVTPTLGSALCELGYDADWSRMGTSARPVRWAVQRAPRWDDVLLEGTALTVPAGVLLDLGSTAKAWTADEAARTVADRLGVGVLVGLGGDLASAGPAPAGGWRVLVRDHVDDPSVVVAVPSGTAIATSSTRSRRWRSGGRELHHVLDPATSQPVADVWRCVTVAARDCVTANTHTTAALVKGTDAVAWLRERGFPARLIDAAGVVTVVNGWPAPRTIEASSGEWWVPQPSRADPPAQPTTRRVSAATQACAEPA
jgi:FAD:protein FMN transferase